jgi:hypothetical protein
MLNILLSFAQFEREVTGERIRDKIAASKAKGMWMGGVPPLGYDVDNRRLVPNECEAKLIRHIFQRFVELGSSTSLFNELKLDGVTSKAWTTQDGKVREGRPIDKGMIYKLLNNRTYLGEVAAQGAVGSGGAPADHRTRVVGPRARDPRDQLPGARRRHPGGRALPAQGHRVRQRRARLVSLALDEEE